MEVTSAQTDLAYACMLKGLSWPWECIMDDLTLEDGSRDSLPAGVNESLYPTPFSFAPSCAELAAGRSELLAELANVAHMAN